MSGRGPEAWRASAAAAIEQRMAREQRTEPTPAERSVLERVAATQQAQQAQNAPPQQAQNATQPQAEVASAAASANTVIENANRHVPVSTQTPANDPELQVFTSGPGGDADAANTRSERETAIAGSGEPAGPTRPTVPNVAPGPTPTGSSATTPAAVRQNAASATANQTPGASPLTPSGGPTGPAGANSQQLGPLRLEFEPNPHNQYDRVAYVFKLCMINDLDAEDPGLLTNFLDNKIRKIIIAETGVTTGFAIGDVVISDTISPNFRNHSNLTTGITIQITEPYSLTLPDRMFMASRELGTQNWRLAPFILQLEFRYIKADGSLYNPTGTQKLIKVYQVMITDFDAQLTETGTKYDVTAAITGNLGFRDPYHIMPQSHRVQTDQGAAQNSGPTVQTGDNTVGTFFNNLGETINRMYIKLREDDNTGARLPILIYKFFVEPDLAKEKITFSPEANARRSSFRTSNTNVGEIVVSRGISVSQVLDDILAGLEDPTYFVQPYADGGLVRIPVIECVTKNVGWDLITNDYVREFNFYIKTKLSNRPVPFQEYGQAIQNSPNLQARRLQEVQKTLKKRYDYFYTGLNTEIISCDIKFNQLHVIPTPLVDVTLPMAPSSAATVNPNNPSITGQTPVATVRATFEEQRLNLSRALTSQRSVLNDVNAGDNPNAPDIARQAAADRAQAEQVLNRISRASVIPFEGNEDAQRRLADITNNSTEGQALRSRLAQSQAENARLAQRREYAEDISRPLTNNMLELSYHADPRDIINSNTRPTNIESASGNNEVSATRPMVSSILAQIYDRSGQHLLEIELEIRGDPYWLGRTALERSRELLSMFNQRPSTNTPTPLPAPAAGSTPAGAAAASTGQTAGSSQVDRDDQDANILLRFRAGAPPKQDTGFMNLSEGSTFFYGIYTIIEVTHEFKQGKFTQRLKGNRDLLINIEQLRQADPVETSRTQPQQVPTAQATQQAGALGQTTPDASLQNPNASPANLTRGTQESVVGVDNTQSPPAIGNTPETREQRRASDRAADAFILSQTRNEEFEGGRGRAPQGNVADLIGSTGRTTSLTGEGGLREPSLIEPRSLPNTRQATYDPATDTFGNTTAGPGQTVDYGPASLQALGARRNSR